MTENPPASHLQRSNVTSLCFCASYYATSRKLQCCTHWNTNWRHIHHVTRVCDSVIIMVMMIGQSYSNFTTFWIQTNFIVRASKFIDHYFRFLSIIFLIMVIAKWRYRTVDDHQLLLYNHDNFDFHNFKSSSPIHLFLENSLIYYLELFLLLLVERNICGRGHLWALKNLF